MYNCLIIGAGGQGALADAPGTGLEHKVISFAHAINDHVGFNLLEYYDSDINKAKKAVEIWGGKAYKTISKSDVFIVTTPDDSHYETLINLVKYRPKLVICEKPICENLTEAREIVQLYKDKRIPLMVGYTRNFMPYYEFDKDIVAATCTFNRGWLHTATHAIALFNKLGVKNYTISEIEECDYRVWDLIIYFADGTFFQERRIADMPVWDYYDNCTMHTMDNAYNFLEGKEPIKCTGEHALRALERCYELMGGIA